MAQIRGYSRDAVLGRVYIGLHLAERNGTNGETAIAIEDRVTRIFPSLLHQAVICLSRIFDKSVAVAIAINVDPFKSSKNVRPDFAEKLGVGSSFVVGRGEQNKQRRAVDSAVVAAERHFAKAGHLSLAHLVKNLPGIRISRSIVTRGLGRGQIGQNAFRHRRRQPQQLKRSNDAVSTKHGAEPRHTCIGIEPMRGLRHHHGKVGARTANPAIELLIGSMNIHVSQRTVARASDSCLQRFAVSH